MDIAGAQIDLVSGYPSAQFGHITSPLSAHTSWVDFFAELNRRIVPGAASTAPVMTQKGPAFDYDLGRCAPAEEATRRFRYAVLVAP